MDDVWNTLAPHLADALIAVLTAAVPVVVAWLRSRAQRLVAQEVTLEAERRGLDYGMSGEQKKALAVELARQRMGTLVRPSAVRLDRIVEDAVPGAQSSLRPPPADDE